MMFARFHVPVSPCTRFVELAGWLAAGLAIAVVVGWAVFQQPLVGPLGVIGLVLTLASCAGYHFWRQTVYCIFILVFVEGFFRNLLNTPNILLVKDALLGIVYLRVCMKHVTGRRTTRAGSQIHLPLIVFAGIVLVQTLNPNVSSIGQALVGLRTWLYYVPLYFVAREMLRQERDLRRFVWFILASATLVCIIAFYQYSAGYQAYSALGEAFANATFVVQESYVGGAGVFRPNATFAWPSHFALFLAFATLVCLGTTLAARRGTKIVLGTVLSVLAATSFIAGQRTLFLLLPLLAAVVLVFQGNRRTVLVLGAVSLVVPTAIVEFRATPAIQRLVGVFQNREGIVGERLSAYWGSFVQAISISVVGLGTGATGIGTRYVNGGEIPLLVEVSLGKVVGDLSLLGLAAYLWVFGALLVNTLGVRARANRENRQFIACLAAAVLAYQLLVLYTGYDLAVVAVPFWFFCGAASQIPATSVESAAEVLPVASGFMR